MQPIESTSGETGAAAAPTTQPRRVLFVDLDGTLISTSYDWEAVAKCVKRRPWTALLVPLWRSTGRAAVRERVGEDAQPNLELLPYRREVVELIRHRHIEGWHVVLVAATNESVARQIAATVGDFDDVLTGPAVDQGGASLRQALVEYCRKHDAPEYSYVGDSAADLEAWSQAKEAVLVAPSSSIERRIRSRSGTTTVLAADRQGSFWPLLARAMRPHHWVKNLLIFTPVVFHHSFFDLRLWSLSGLAFALFCLATSAVYLLNDLLDVESDRRHPVKKNRPFASGRLRVEQGLVAAAILLTTSFGIALATLPLEFTYALLAYIVLNALYSTWLKRKVMIDILVLASFYCLRIIAGGAATDIVPSEWLLALSMFLFLSLAFLKRHGELIRLREEGLARTDNRGYRVHDLEMLETMGATSGYLAVLVLALYINSNQVIGLYSHPRVLWLVCPLLLYWVSRAWIWARRGAIAEDPLMFALKDRVSWTVLVLVVLLAVLSL
jgi:4-hydroxybenzoate polyprenyltransferase/phosphoserine phosphatase